MLADILARSGYDVLNLGANTPPASLAAALTAHEDVRAVVVSVVDRARLRDATRLVAAARHADPDVPIVAGGFAVPDEATARAIGADGWASDPRRLATLIAGIAAPRAP